MMKIIGDIVELEKVAETDCKCFELAERKKRELMGYAGSRINDVEVVVAETIEVEVDFDQFKSIFDWLG